jgi:Arc/MetJ-type ribon-helix-helix transcriptional regulator
MSGKMSQNSTFTFNDETTVLIDDLMKEFKWSSRAEVIRKALAALELVRREKAKGNQLAFVDDEDKIISKVLIV